MNIENEARRNAQKEGMESLVKAASMNAYETAYPDPNPKLVKPRLVIVINGGCVVNVYASQDQSVEVFDYYDFEWIKDSWNKDIDKATAGLTEIY